MITKKDLDSAIAECLGKRSPDASTCVKLAAFYTIRREMYGEQDEPARFEYSYAPAPIQTKVYIDGESEFARIVDGRDQDEVMPVINELMETLSVIQPRLYNAVMDKLA